MSYTESEGLKKGRMNIMQKNKEKNYHSEACQCQICQKGIEAVREMEQKMIEEYGHSIRYIFNSYETEFGTFPSIFTRGLPETAKHPNLEFVLPVDEETAKFLLNTLAAKIHEGWTVELNRIYQIPELNDVPFYFEESIQPEIGESLYRVILADPQLKLPHEEGCELGYQLQLMIGSVGNDSLSVH